MAGYKKKSVVILYTNNKPLENNIKEYTIYKIIICLGMNPT